MKEVWRNVPIKEYAHLYQVSNLGHVRSKDRWIKQKNGSKAFKTGRILKPLSDGRGYLKVVLCNKPYRRRLFIHRLVALAFIPNPNNLPEVNHINENKRDNCASNLEWCTRLYNINYGTLNKRRIKTVEKAVAQIDTKGKIIKIFHSANEASITTGINRSSIQGVASHYVYYNKNGERRRRQTAGGYKWKYIKKGK